MIIILMVVPGVDVKNRNIVENIYINPGILPFAWWEEFCAETTRPCTLRNRLGDAVQAMSSESLVDGTFPIRRSCKTGDPVP